MMKRRLLIFCLFMVCATVFGAETRCDQARYEHMQQVINSSTNKLLGISLEKATHLLSLENVKWDEGYTSVPRGQLRVYHFQGFYLLLSLQAEPQGTNIANFYPALAIDGITNSQVRMSNYWAEVHAYFKQRTEEMHKQTRP